jgi:hypothetical protein
MVQPGRRARSHRATSMTILAPFSALGHPDVRERQDQSVTTASAWHSVRSGLVVRRPPRPKRCGVRGYLMKLSRAAPITLSLPKQTRSPPTRQCRLGTVYWPSARTSIHRLLLIVDSIATHCLPTTGRDGRHERLVQRVVPFFPAMRPGKPRRSNSIEDGGGRVSRAVPRKSAGLDFLLAQGTRASAVKPVGRSFAEP